MSSPQQSDEPRVRRHSAGTVFFERTWKILKYFSIGFADIIYPRNCPVSGEAVDNSKFTFLSKSGAGELYFIDGASACTKCGMPPLRGMFDGGVCDECRDRVEELQFGRSRSVVALDGMSSQLVYMLKYWNQPAIAKDMANLASEKTDIADFLAGSVLVPVPLYKTRLQARGYNQSKKLANELSRIAAGTKISELLERVRDTGTQTKLTAEKRRKNVKGAFAVKHGLYPDPLERYVLVDDVFTTGSTLSECAMTLREAGAVNIDAVTFAHG